MGHPIPQKNTRNLSSLSLLECGKEILTIEATAIHNIAELLDENFEIAVKIILEMTSEGRVLVSGMGKAGFVAMKISATLASTGTSSYFLHPAEAVHGDLGRYRKNDIALILSNSGETEEIIRILPRIKQMGCPVISITGNPLSELATHSDVTLNIGKPEEVCPLGLAPTTSTTAMLALGDALAMTVQSRREFSREEYAFYHPAGSLGRSLMLASEIMRKGEEHCLVDESMQTRKVIQKITNTKGRPGAATVIDAQGKLAGIFTDGALRRHLEQKSDFLDLPIRDLMTKNPKTVFGDQLATEVMNLVRTLKIDQVIVVNKENAPIGLIDVQDLMEIKV